MLCASYSRNPWEGQYWPVIDYVIIVDTQHTNILINTDRISESQKIDKNSALICSGKLSDIINIKKIYAWPSLLHFEFELNMSSSDDLLSQAHKLCVFGTFVFYHISGPQEPPLRLNQWLSPCISRSRLEVY